MNKELEALEALENIRQVLRDDFDFPFNLTPEYRIIFKALKRNESIKPRTKKQIQTVFKLRACSVCDTTIEKEFVYCPCCGQKLDWSDDK